MTKRLRHTVRQKRKKQNLNQYKKETFSFFCFDGARVSKWAHLSVSWEFYLAGQLWQKDSRYRDKWRAWAKELNKYNNNNNDNNGNFICVFECTIVNLATYRQFTNAAWDWIIKKKKRKSNQNCIKSGLSQFLYLQQKIIIIIIIIILIIINERLKEAPCPSSLPLFLLNLATKIVKNSTSLNHWICWGKFERD